MFKSDFDKESEIKLVIGEFLRNEIQRLQRENNPTDVKYLAIRISGSALIEELNKRDVKDAIPSTTIKNSIVRYFSEKYPIDDNNACTYGSEIVDEYKLVVTPSQLGIRLVRPVIKTEIFGEKLSQAFEDAIGTIYNPSFCIRIPNFESWEKEYVVKEFEKLGWVANIIRIGESNLHYCVALS